MYDYLYSSYLFFVAVFLYSAICREDKSSFYCKESWAINFLCDNIRFQTSSGNSLIKILLVDNSNSKFSEKKAAAIIYTLILRIIIHLRSKVFHLVYCIDNFLIRIGGKHFVVFNITYILSPKLLKSSHTHRILHCTYIKSI